VPQSGHLKGRFIGHGDGGDEGGHHATLIMRLVSKNHVNANQSGAETAIHTARAGGSRKITAMGPVTMTPEWSTPAIPNSSPMNVRGTRRTTKKKGK